MNFTSGIKTKETGKKIYMESTVFLHLLEGNFKVDI